MEGDALSVTVTPTDGAATALPLLSEAIALKETTPVVVGVQLITQVGPARVALPRETPLANTCTDVIEPSASEAVPVMMVWVPMPRKEPLAGVTIDARGATPICWVTVIGTSGDVTTIPFESITRTDR